MEWLFIFMAGNKERQVFACYQFLLITIVDVTIQPYRISDTVTQQSEKRTKIPQLCRAKRNGQVLIGDLPASEMSAQPRGVKPAKGRLLHIQQTTPGQLNPLPVFKKNTISLSSCVQSGSPFLSSVFRSIENFWLNPLFRSVLKNTASCCC